MSCLKEEHVDIWVAFMLKVFFSGPQLQLYVVTFYQMAAALAPRLSPDTRAPNKIDFHHLRVFLNEYFSSLPDTTVTISPNVESSSIWPHILDYRIFPSLFRNYYVTTKSFGYPEHGSAEHSNVPYVTMGAVPCPVPFRTVHTHMPAIGPPLKQGLYNVSALPQHNKSYAPKPSSPNFNGTATVLCRPTYSAFPSEARRLYGSQLWRFDHSSNRSVGVEAHSQLSQEGPK